MTLVEQELLTLPEHLSSPFFSGIRVIRSLVLWVCFVARCLSFCTFLLAIVLLAIDLRIMTSPLVSSNSSSGLEINASKQANCELKFQFALILLVNKVRTNRILLVVKKLCVQNRI